MKKFLLGILMCVVMPVCGVALGFNVSSMKPATEQNIRAILPRQDRLEDPTAVVFIKSNIANLSVRGPVTTLPRAVKGGYVLCVPQGTDYLYLDAPLHSTQQIRFAPLRAGKYYEMQVSTRGDKNRRHWAARQSTRLDLDKTQVDVKLVFDYMEVPETLRNQRAALIYLDKTLRFDQWQKLLLPNGSYTPFDIYDNLKNPCCIVVANGTSVDEVFRTRKLTLDSYVEKLEGGNTYHVVLTRTPKVPTK